MRPDDPGAWLFSRTTGGIRFGLERTEALLAGAGNPHRRFRALHVGGTNGKGSVSALCESVLRAAHPELRIGLYTSPHLVSFTERIRIDGRPISVQALADAEARLRPEVERLGATFFEATTALAFLCFAEADVDLAIVEVGLGGRLDSTNVIEPMATAVTNVALDHVEYLGDTPEQIAWEKGGIFKPGVPAVIGETAPGPLDVLRRRADEAGAPRVEVDADAVSDVRVSLEGTRFRLSSDYWGEREVRIPLIGAHQARNAAVAAELLAALPEDVRPSWEAVEAGFAAVRWVGRMQVERQRGATWIFDVAHNPAGVAALTASLDSIDLPRPVVLIAAVLLDKEWDAMLPPLLARADAAILTVADSAPAERRWDPEQAARSLDAPIPVRVIPSLADALMRAETLAPYGTLLVTGSVHTVGDALGILQIPVV
ncbi:folylpolyglutamate synthase/dihydrofolate synthase family protein [Longimicrobium sp.]|uniref:bifunctional folylpolyglutamate synthase/dihydrofolate synthase n=1 Tax=Longimicrobium sp. TaxID=2029185 RepID=UPI002E3726B5|nr:folylpolyglutamate synthase/dihydrofolate synthase family protein [Longimicrobium sp.]HEX6038163.1 folylpolyglutamate synthase/dihydrofolate synthase family protein [Longimicrobium sp.]